MPPAERCLSALGKVRTKTLEREVLSSLIRLLCFQLDSGQLKSVGGLVKVEGIRGALEQVRKLLKDIKDKEKDLLDDDAEEPDPPCDFEKNDCLDEEVGYIFDILRYS